MAKKAGRNTKARIVAAAWRLFYEQGYEDTTVEDIVFESETSKGSFYHYFEGKDALLGSLSVLFDEKYEELRPRIDPEADAVETLVFLNRELFNMIDNSVSLELLARLFSSQLGKSTCWTATALILSCCTRSSGTDRAGGSCARTWRPMRSPRPMPCLSGE